MYILLLLLEASLFSNAILKWVDLVGWGDGEEVEGREGRETIIRIYGKNYFQLNENKDL